MIVRKGIYQMSEIMAAPAAIYEEVEGIGTPSVAEVIAAQFQVRIPPPPAAYLTQRPAAPSAPPTLRETAGRVARAVLNTFITVRVDPEDGPGVAIIFGGSSDDVRAESQSWRRTRPATS